MTFNFQLFSGFPINLSTNKPINQKSWLKLSKKSFLYNNPELLHRDNIVIPHDIKVQGNVQFYPNPANDVLSISTAETFVSGSKIELYDITGRMVYSTTINTESSNASISLKEVKQGLYLCVIKNREEIIFSSKISVIKQ